MKLSVIIPVYNEETTVQEVVNRVQSVEINKEIIIVNDGSTDKTGKFLNELRNKDLTILSHPKNMGKGASIRTAIQKASGEIIIIQDADLESNPNEYDRLTEPIKQGKTDVTYGSRFINGRGKTPPVSYAANRFLTGLTNILYGSSLTDMETCYKCLKTKTLKEMRVRANRFDFEPELTAKLLKKGYSILEVPVSYEFRTISSGKKIGWKDGISAIYTLLKYRFVS